MWGSGKRSSGWIRCGGLCASIKWTWRSPYPRFLPFHHQPTKSIGKGKLEGSSVGKLNLPSKWPRDDDNERFISSKVTRLSFSTEKSSTCALDVRFLGLCMHDQNRPSKNSNYKSKTLTLALQKVSAKKPNKEMLWEQFAEPEHRKLQIEKPDWLSNV